MVELMRLISLDGINGFLCFGGTVIDGERERE